MTGALIHFAIACEAHADPRTDREATDLYVQGSEHAAKNRCDQAVPLLERSYALLESPNTALLLGRCLRDTGSPEEAFVRYEVAVQRAQERVARGELRYAPTERSARSERDALRAQMGTLLVRGLTPGDRLEVYRLRVDPGTDTSAVVVVRAGSTRLRITRAGAPARELAVTVAAGAETAVDLAKEALASPPGGTAPPPAPVVKEDPPSVVKDEPPGWIVPTAIVASAVGGLGLVAFTFLGLGSERVWRDLEECSPACPESRRDAARLADRDQTLANVSLGVGAPFAALGVALAIYRITWSPSSTTRAAIAAGPGGAVLRASF